MKPHFRALFLSPQLLAALGVVGSVAVACASVFAPGATLTRLASGFAFTEGPTCDAAGNVFFVDQPNNRIEEWSTNGQLSTFLQPSGHANGMMFDAHGRLIACADEHNELWAIAPDRSYTVLVTNYQGKYLNGPNDVWVAPNGGMYLTDPFYRRPWWDHTGKVLPWEAVFYLDPDLHTLTVVADNLRRPNGITGTPDGKTLFVSDINDGRTWRYAIRPDGSLTNRTLFCHLGSDGMTMDALGNLYLTGHGVSVFAPNGDPVERLNVPEPWTANVCFGGADRHTLFITASRHLYSIRMNVAGANPAK